MNNKEIEYIPDDVRFKEGLRIIYKQNEVTGACRLEVHAAPEFIDPILRLFTKEPRQFIINHNLRENGSLPADQLALILTHDAVTYLAEHNYDMDEKIISSIWGLPKYLPKRKFIELRPSTPQASSQPAQA